VPILLALAFLILNVKFTYFVVYKYFALGSLIHRLMPRSKLGLQLPVEKILAKHKCNPVSLLAEMVMEKDPKGGWMLKGRDRLMALCRLMEYQKPKPKSVEVVAEQDRSIQIVRQTFTLPETGGGNGASVDISLDGNSGSAE